LRADKSHAVRLRRICCATEEVVETETHPATFAHAEAIAANHSTATLGHDSRKLAEGQPGITELREIGRSVEDRPI
jgi:carboxypeptidase T